MLLWENSASFSANQLPSDFILIQWFSFSFSQSTYTLGRGMFSVCSNQSSSFLTSQPISGLISSVLKFSIFNKTFLQFCVGSSDVPVKAYCTHSLIYCTTPCPPLSPYLVIYDPWKRQCFIPEFIFGSIYLELVHGCSFGYDCATCILLRFNLHHTVKTHVHFL